jgi:hypothetical protein
MGAVGFDFLPGGCVDTTAGGEAFRDRFGEIHFPCSEEVAQEADIVRRIMESFGDDRGWEAIDKRGPQGFITALPIRDGMGKEGGVAVHERHYII